jgi:hypothetical protein
MSNVKILFHIGYFFGKMVLQVKKFLTMSSYVFASCVGIYQAFQKHFH